MAFTAGLEEGNSQAKACWRKPEWEELEEASWAASCCRMGHCYIIYQHDADPCEISTLRTCKSSSISWVLNAPISLCVTLGSASASTVHTSNKVKAVTIQSWRRQYIFAGTQVFDPPQYPVELQSLEEPGVEQIRPSLSKLRSRIEV